MSQQLYQVALTYKAWSYSDVAKINSLFECLGYEDYNPNFDTQDIAHTGFIGGLHIEADPDSPKNRFPESVIVHKIVIKVYSSIPGALKRAVERYLDCIEEIEDNTIIFETINYFDATTKLPINIRELDSHTSVRH